MNIAIRQKALYGLWAVFFGITGYAVAQDAGVTVTAPALSCSGGADCPGQETSISIMGAPPMPAQLGVITTGGAGFGFREKAEAVKNQPYQGQAVTEIKQTLSDGSHIAQTTTATVARDSDGRTVRIQKLSAIGPWKSASDSSEANSPTLTTIFDPVSKTHTDYTSDTKVAHVLTMPTLPAGLPNPPTMAMKGAAGGFAVFSAGPGGGGVGPTTFSVQGHSDSSPEMDSRDAKTESLGAKTIEGIPVTGAKTTNTIPAGTIGNDKDIVITRETWYSPDLKLVLQSTQSDPRFGETSYTLTNIQHSEPDPALFQVPAGYTIEKVPALQVQTR